MWLEEILEEEYSTSSIHILWALLHSSRSDGTASRKRTVIQASCFAFWPGLGDLGKRAPASYCWGGTTSHGMAAWAGSSFPIAQAGRRNSLSTPCFDLTLRAQKLPAHTGGGGEGSLFVQ